MVARGGAARARSGHPLRVRADDARSPRSAGPSRLRAGGPCVPDLRRPTGRAGRRARGCRTGFRLLDALTEEWVAERAECHRRAFDPSVMTPERYAAFRAAPGYDPELRRGGRLRRRPGRGLRHGVGGRPRAPPASCEPVGTRPHFWRRGLGQVANREALQRLRRRGHAPGRRQHLGPPRGEHRRSTSRAASSGSPPSTAGYAPADQRHGWAGDRAEASGCATRGPGRHSSPASQDRRARLRYRRRASPDEPRRRREREAEMARSFPRLVAAALVAAVVGLAPSAVLGRPGVDHGDGRDHRSQAGRRQRRRRPGVLGAPDRPGEEPDHRHGEGGRSGRVPRRRLAPADGGDRVGQPLQQRARSSTGSASAAPRATSRS